MRRGRRKTRWVVKGECYVSENAVNRALAHLKTCYKDKPKQGGCGTGRRDGVMSDDQVRLPSRQLQSVMRELRKAVLRHDWNETATLLMLLCSPGMRDHTKLILRVCFLLLCCHPRSNMSLMSEFIRDCTEYDLEADVMKFIRILFVLREAPPAAVKKGCYIRKGIGYRIIDDVMFQDV